MSKDITIDSPEFKALYDEVRQRAETIRKREELSDKSFKDWLCDTIEVLAKELGYHIQNIYEFALDIGDAFNNGFEAGRLRAKQNAYRKRKGR